jgi:hypothetical protein
MPKGRFSTLTSWSYSVYTQYLKCPFSVCLDKIQRVRIVEPPNPAFAKGDRVHALTDTYIGGVGRKPALVEELPPARKGELPIQINLKAIQPTLDIMRKAKARTEQEWCFNQQWLPTGWLAGDAWLRIKTDVCADTVEPPTVNIIDWKTGKVYPDHAQQRSLYGLGGLLLVQIGVLAGGSKAVDLTAQHVYTDTGQSATEKFKMKDLKPLQKEWLARIKAMMTDTEYKAKPGPACRYCRFGKSKGGPCQAEKV